MFWLEPMVEVETARGRIAYGPVTPADVPGLFDAGFLDWPRAEHRLCLGLTEEIGYLKRQERLTFARVGIVDPVSSGRLPRAWRLSRARARAFDARGKDRRRSRRVGIARTRRCGLSRRNQMAHHASRPPRTQKYVVCNADEGDSGTFSDRMIMEGDPFVLIEGMTIAAICAGATEGTSICALNIRTRYAR